MRRFLLIAIVLTSSAMGCRNTLGPIETRHLPRADAPGYTIAEQERRGRQRLSILEDNYAIGPNAYINRPSPTGR